VTERTLSVFISYSHEDKELASALASALRKRGVGVWIDEGELKIGDSIIEQIATAIAEVEFFLALVSKASLSSNWCRKELALAITGDLGREGVKVLPLRVDGAEMPDSLVDVFYLELNIANVGEVAREIKAATSKHRIEKRRPDRTPAGNRTSRAETVTPASRDASSTKSDQPIRIVGIVKEGVGTPRTDGSRGSALYRIPLRLSRQPSPVWARHFVDTWDHPPQFTMMHRPGIASVSGDTVILDGTTMEELERYHLKTLRYVLIQVNADVAAHEARERVKAEREAQLRLEHEESVRDIASRLKFD
jgi:hypothetical protein